MLEVAGSNPTHTRSFLEFLFIWVILKSIWIKRNSQDIDTNWVCKVNVECGSISHLNEGNLLYETIGSAHNENVIGLPLIQIID